MVNSWSFSILNDSVGNATLFNGLNYTFNSSTYGSPNSVISLNNGFFQIPPGDNYINPVFSVWVWVNANSNKSFTNIVSFSNNHADLVWIGLQNLKVYVEIQPSAGNLTTMTAKEPVPLHGWMHVAFTLKSGIGYIYYNGVEQNNARLAVPTKT